MTIASLNEALSILRTVQALVVAAETPPRNPAALGSLGNFMRENAIQVNEALQYLEDNLPPGDKRRPVAGALKQALGSYLSWTAQTHTTTRKIGKYTVLGTLGQGAMGVVYRAR